MSAIGSATAIAPVIVRLPSPLRSYADGAAEIGVDVPLLTPDELPTLDAVLAALDAACTGLRFRIVDERGVLRAHIRIFIDADMTRDLQQTVPAAAIVMIVAALSGG